MLESNLHNGMEIQSSNINLDRLEERCMACPNSLHLLPIHPHTPEKSERTGADCHQSPPPFTGKSKEMEEGTSGKVYKILTPLPLISHGLL